MDIFFCYSSFFQTLTLTLTLESNPATFMNFGDKTKLQFTLLTFARQFFPSPSFFGFHIFPQGKKRTLLPVAISYVENVMIFRPPRCMYSVLIKMVY